MTFRPPFRWTAKPRRRKRHQGQCIGTLDRPRAGREGNLPASKRRGNAHRGPHWSHVPRPPRSTPSIRRTTRDHPRPAQGSWSTSKTRWVPGIVNDPKDMFPFPLSQPTWIKSTRTRRHPPAADTLISRLSQLVAAGSATKAASTSMSRRASTTSSACHPRPVRGAPRRSGAKESARSPGSRRADVRAVEQRTPAEFRAKAAEYARAAQADWGPLCMMRADGDPGPLSRSEIFAVQDRRPLRQGTVGRAGPVADPIRGTVRGPHGRLTAPRRGMAA